jgi:hypothetical protein
MKIFLKYLDIVIIGFSLLFLLSKCSSTNKIKPEYNGVDSELIKYVKEYKELAKMRDITFNHNVTIGFKKLDGDTVGITWYGLGWREIDIDKYFWKYSTPMEKECLIFHELDHAYCDRSHDFGNGTPYPEYAIWKDGKEPQIGRYNDGCPLSIMFPAILGDNCMLVHYNEYLTELFNRCVPY